MTAGCLVGANLASCRISEISRCGRRHRCWRSLSTGRPPDCEARRERRYEVSFDARRCRSAPTSRKEPAQTRHGVSRHFCRMRSHRHLKSRVISTPSSGYAFCHPPQSLLYARMSCASGAEQSRCESAWWGGSMHRIRNPPPNTKNPAPKTDQFRVPGSRYWVMSASTAYTSPADPSSRRLPAAARAGCSLRAPHPPRSVRYASCARSRCTALRR